MEALVIRLLLIGLAVAVVLLFLYQFNVFALVTGWHSVDCSSSLKYDETYYQIIGVEYSCTGSCSGISVNSIKIMLPNLTTVYSEPAIVSLNTTPSFYDIILYSKLSPGTYIVESTLSTGERVHCRLIIGAR